MVDVVGLSLSLIAATALGVTSIFVRLGTQQGRSNEVVLLTFGINVLLVVPFTLLYYYPDYGLTVRSFLAFAAAGATGTLIGRALFYKSIDRIGASRTEPVKATQPLHAAIVAAIVLGEALAVENMVGILLIIVGLAVVSREIVNNNRGIDDVSPVMLIVPLGAAFFFGIEPTFAKIGFGDATPVLVGLMIKIVVAATGMAAYLRLRNEFPSVSLGSLDSETRKWILLAGMTNTTFLFAYYAALEIAPVVLVVPIVQMSPLVVVVLSLLFLSRMERVTPRLVASAMIIIAGAIIVTLTS